MVIARSLAGWIAFAVALAFAEQQWAVLVGLIVSLLSLAAGLFASRTWSTVVIELSTVIFFALATAMSFSLPQLADGPWISVGSQVWLAATVAITLLIRAPFTLAIAKREAPEEVWDTPWFYAFNVKITTAWLISFAVSSVALIIVTATGIETIWAHAPIIAAAIILPVHYTNRLIRGLPVPGKGESAPSTH